MQRRKCFGLLALGLRAAPTRAFPWQGLTESIQKYIGGDGRTNYDRLKQDLAPLREVLSALETFSVESLADPAARLAHWLNAYNACVLESLAADYPRSKAKLENPLKRRAFFQGRKFTVAGAQYTLAEIDKRYLRATGDPRVHLARFSGARSSPALARDIYQAQSLDRQLEAQTMHFLRNSQNLSLDKVRRTARVSALFHWYRKDFGGNSEAVLRFVARRLPEASIQASTWKLEYLPWDWSLADAS